MYRLYSLILTPPQKSNMLIKSHDHFQADRLLTYNDVIKVPLNISLKNKQQMLVVSSQPFSSSDYRQLIFLKYSWHAVMASS